MNIEVIVQQKPMTADDVARLSEHIIENSIRPPFEFVYENQWQVFVGNASKTQILQYSLAQEEPEPLEMGGTTLFVSQRLPHRDFQHQLQQLHFDEQLIRRLLAFPLVAMAQTPGSIIKLSMHRMLLLRGPPGSGKTSVALAAFHNAAKRVPGVLITVNAHALFSKWFSESGKTVQKLFTAVREFAEESPVYLLIDEVESLAASRTRQNEPGDAVRAANAVLTQLDQLRGCQKLAIICTSNLADELDPAFLDRCDCVFDIGQPGPEQRRQIIEDIVSACAQPQREQADSEEIDTFCSSAQKLQESVSSVAVAETVQAPQFDQCSATVDELVSLTEGMSGRMLRKIPILALLECFDDLQTTQDQPYPPTEQLLGLMKRAILSKQQKIL